ncbi:MAG: serpin family protein [Gemmatimonadetes bacterium]|nr:serpin family protein [Gemmatimonadota bacterium]
MTARLVPPVVAALGVALLIACAGATEPRPGDPSPVLEALPRALSPGEQKIIAANNDFSFSLFRQLGADNADSNVFVSPLSASMALGMAMNGASGPTFDQMRATLGFGAASESEIDQGYKSLITLLRTLDPAVDFRIANSIWARDGFPIKPAFLDAGRTWFDAQAATLDFASPGAVKSINDWVSTATTGKIPIIVDQIRPDEVMFLINAIYFKGSWRAKFDPALTADAPFHGIAGDQPAKLMHREGTIRYLQTPTFSAVDLPYGNSAYSMSVVLPSAGQSVDAVLASLQADAWSAWTSQFRDTELDLYLPRLELTWGRMLIPELQALGMRAAFQAESADFSRMSSVGLFISTVKQKTYVKVNEEGTEAAAATSVGMTVTSAPLRTLFRVDRPYVFVIRERLSGTILFLGAIRRMP